MLSWCLSVSLSTHTDIYLSLFHSVSLSESFSHIHTFLKSLKCFLFHSLPYFRSLYLSISLTVTLSSSLSFSLSGSFLSVRPSLSLTCTQSLCLSQAVPLTLSLILKVSVSSFSVTISLYKSVFVSFSLSLSQSLFPTLSLSPCLTFRVFLIPFLCISSFKRLCANSIIFSTSYSN